MSLSTIASTAGAQSRGAVGDLEQVTDPAVLRCEALLWRAVAEASHGDLYVWGAGSAGQSVAAALQQRGGTVTAFIESDGRRTGERLGGIPIADPRVLAGRAGQPCGFVIVASAFSTAIVNLLAGMSWPATAFAVIDATPLLPGATVAATASRPAADSRPRNALGHVFSWGRGLQDAHVHRCRVVPNREQMLCLLPAGGTVAEIGTLRGEFARAILATVRPSTFHIIDIDMSRLDREALERSRGPATVHLHEGDSATILETFPDHTFDWVYIDGDHSQAGVRRDALAAMRKITAGGLLVFNDYTAYSPLELCPYGTVDVVHELCLDHGFEMIYLALQGLGYYDVVLARRDATS